MAKLTAWLVTLIGIALLLPLVGVTQLGTPTQGILAWVIAVSAIIIGIGKLVRNYSNKRRR